MNINKISFANVLKQKAKNNQHININRLQSLRQIFDKYEDNPNCQYTLFLAQDNKNSMMRNGSNLRISNILNSNKLSEGSQMFDSWIQKQTQINKPKNNNFNIAKIGTSLNLKENMKNHNQNIKQNNKNTKKIILNSKTKVEPSPNTLSKVIQKNIQTFNQTTKSDKNSYIETKASQKYKQQGKSSRIELQIKQEFIPKKYQKIKQNPRNYQKPRFMQQPTKQTKQQFHKQPSKQLIVQTKTDDLKFDLEIIDEQIKQLAYKYQKQTLKKQQEEEQQLLISQSFKNKLPTKKINNKQIDMNEDERSIRRWQQAKMKIGGYLQQLEKKKESISIPYQQYKYTNKDKDESFMDKYRKEYQQDIAQKQIIEIPMLKFQTPKTQNINIPYLKEVQSERVPSHQQNQQKFDYLLPQKDQLKAPFVKEVQMAQSINYMQDQNTYSMHHNIYQLPYNHEINHPLQKQEKFTKNIKKLSYQEHISPQIQFKISPKTQTNNNQYLQRYMVDGSGKESLVYTAQKPQIMINIPADFDEAYRQIHSNPIQQRPIQEVKESFSNFNNLVQQKQQEPLKVEQKHQIPENNIPITNNNFEYPAKVQITAQPYLSAQYSLIKQNTIKQTQYIPIIEQKESIFFQESNRMQNNSLIIKNQNKSHVINHQSYIRQLIKDSVIQQKIQNTSLPAKEQFINQIQSNDIMVNMKKSNQGIKKDVDVIHNSNKQDSNKIKVQNSSKKSSPSNQFGLKKVYSSPKTMELSQANLPATSNFNLNTDTNQLKKSIEPKFSMKTGKIDTSYLKIDTLAYNKIDTDKYANNKIKQEEEQQFKFEL